MNLIFKSAFTLFGGIQPEKLLSQSTLNVSNDATAVLSKPPTLSSQSLETLFQKDINLICSNPTQQKTQSVQRSSKTVRRNNKYLTTCRRCGHLRFGQKNKKSYKDTRNKLQTMGLRSELTELQLSTILVPEEWR